MARIRVSKGVRNPEPSLSPTRLPPVLPPHLSTLLAAVTRNDAAGAAAFRAWRAATPLDDIDSCAFKVMPMLAAVAAREGVPEADLARMKGVARYTWVANTLRLRELFEVIDVLAEAGIGVMVIKGAALFARDAALATRRMSDDYDILLEPGTRAAACAALAAAGYSPGQGFSWEEVAHGMPERSGAPVRRSAEQGEVDLHWRPLQGIADPGLPQLFWDAAEAQDLQGKAVRVPALADHLFAALARPEPWETTEAFQRLVEAFLIIRTWPGGIDWQRLAGHARRYGLGLRLERLLSVLAETCGLALPAAAAPLRAAPAGRAERLEEWLRGIAPEARPPLAQWYLARADRRRRRDDPAREPLPLLHALALQAGVLTDAELRRQWRDAVELERRFPPSGLRFSRGFSRAEPGGRWTDGPTAGLRIPLPGGAPQVFTLPVLPHAKPGTRVRVRSCSGARISRQLLPAAGGAMPRLEITVEPVPALGGDGFVLFDLGFAQSPAALGASPDIRRLGLFFPLASTAPLAGQALP